MTCKPLFKQCVVWAWGQGCCSSSCRLSCPIIRLAPWREPSRHGSAKRRQKGLMASGRCALQQTVSSNKAGAPFLFFFFFFLFRMTSWADDRASTSEMAATLSTRMFFAAVSRGNKIVLFLPGAVGWHMLFHSSKLLHLCRVKAAAVARTG